MAVMWIWAEAFKKKTTSRKTRRTIWITMQHSWRPLSNLDPAYRIRCSAGWSSCPELCGHCTNMGSRPSARTNWSVMWHPIEVGGLSRWQSPKHPPRLDLSTASHSDVPCSLIAFWKMMSDSYHIYTVYTSILYRWSYLQLWIYIYISCV